ncbi:MAG: hypothetical protein WC897_00625 [Candidatus Gracilibacteria bacterium]
MELTAQEQMIVNDLESRNPLLDSSFWRRLIRGETTDELPSPLANGTVVTDQDIGCHLQAHNTLTLGANRPIEVGRWDILRAVQKAMSVLNGGAGRWIQTKENSAGLVVVRSSLQKGDLGVRISSTFSRQDDKLCTCCADVGRLIGDRETVGVRLWYEQDNDAIKRVCLELKDGLNWEEGLRLPPE